MTFSLQYLAFPSDQLSKTRQYPFERFAVEITCLARCEDEIGILNASSSLDFRIKDTSAFKKYKGKTKAISWVAGS